jgi:hypothetical protein
MQAGPFRSSGRVYVKSHFVPKELERATGIEPAWPVWKTGTLPLSYARKTECIVTEALALSIRPYILGAHEFLAPHWRPFD